MCEGLFIAGSAVFIMFFIYDFLTKYGMYLTVMSFFLFVAAVSSLDYSKPLK